MTAEQLAEILAIQRDSIPFLSQFFGEALPVIFVFAAVMACHGAIAYLLRSMYRAVGIRSESLAGFSPLHR